MRNQGRYFLAFFAAAFFATGLAALFALTALFATGAALTTGVVTAAVFLAGAFFAGAAFLVVAGFFGAALAEALVAMENPPFQTAAAEEHKVMEWIGVKITTP
jgi:uncharacterized membrane-anchored protein